MADRRRSWRTACLAVLLLVTPRGANLAQEPPLFEAVGASVAAPDGA